MRKKKRQQSRPVITTENASELLGISLCIDKINFSFTSGIKDKELIDYLENRKLDFKQSRLKSEKTIQVGHFYFIFYSFSNEYIVKLQSNPSKYDSFLEYLKNFDLICSGLSSELKPNRLDVAIDFSNKAFKWLNSRLVVPKKNLIERYVLRGCEEQTRYFGKEPKQMVLYDQDEHPDKSKSGVRLESRTKGSSNIQASSFEELLTTLTSPSFNPFKGVLVKDFRFRKVEKCIQNIDDLLVKEKIKTLIEHNGFVYTKKVFNKHRNASRDLGKFLSEKGEANIGSLYQDLMKGYLSIEEDL
jgi:hypothetical protein